MPIDPTGGAAAGITAGGAAGPGGAGQNASSNSLGDLDDEAFLQLLVAQMRYQDPMEPADHTQMLQQTAMFTQVEALQKVTESQQQLLGMGQTQMANDMIGHDVTAEIPGEGTVTGMVEAVRYTDQGPMLRMADGEVPLQYVMEVRAVDATPPPAEPPEEPEEGDDVADPEGDDVVESDESDEADEPLDA
ncbi:flagellar hook assembly protein FlgD [Egibacter rhizosphaerae]|nr:flagellar hook capping FlgD N-terminal domain-containing protein [Egibacter rhizosphaerae]